MKFVLNQPVPMEESLTCEFKEVKSNPLQAVSGIVDEHVVAFLNEDGGSIFWGIRNADRVVTGMRAADKLRDELRQVIGQKVAAIAPSISASLIEAPFHDVLGATGESSQDICVLEVRVARPEKRRLYLTGGGQAYRRTLGGTKKLSGAELYVALGQSVEVERGTPSVGHDANFPGIYRRAAVAAPLLRGKRVLWVDDNPAYTHYERIALSEMGIIVDIATSTREALDFCRRLRPDVVVSDMARGFDATAGLELLDELRRAAIKTPLAFYVGALDGRRGTPIGAIGITNMPNEILHLVMDALERIN